MLMRGGTPQILELDVKAPTCHVGRSLPQSEPGIVSVQLADWGHPVGVQVCQCSIGPGETWLKEPGAIVVLVRITRA